MGEGGCVARASGAAAFIQVKNLTNAALEFNVYYRDALGEDATPVPNTYVLAANASVGFRPVVSDTGWEGVGAGVPDAERIGKLTLVGSPVSAGGSGGVVIASTGDIVGAVIGFNLSTGSTYAYDAMDAP